ncbi:M23 family metallopeptidase [Sorangium sp. So ce185]|uniref:M23 family metallopeptidase n=1 Tax=Sorangium sp. So ce185 TaxID=3133287 RepID=UPI003F603469
MSLSRRPGRRALSRLCGAAAVLLGGGGVIGVGCGQEPPAGDVAPPPLGPQDDTDACECAGGFYYNNQPIPLAETRCDTFVCGRDLISYQCLDGDTAADTWRSYPENRCGDLACPAEGTFCGEDMVNGEPAALYQCPGAGQIPLEWRICPGGCDDGACTGAASGECPCEVPPIPGGERIPVRCGLTLCMPTGVGGAGVKQVCTAEGWRNLGLACNQPQGDCPACRGVQGSSGREITTTACGAEVCGLGVGNQSRWMCGEEGWLDLNLPCDPGASNGEAGAALGRCPVEFRDNDGQWKPVEPGQTFCGDQVFGGRANKDLAINLGELDLRIHGRADRLYACPGPGARPVLYRDCGGRHGSGACMRVREIPPVRWHEAIGAHAGANEPKIRDWDRCDESCPPVSDALRYFPAYTNGGTLAQCEHVFCGQDVITGRVGTLYHCAYDLVSANYTCPPSSDTAVVGRPVPYEECPGGCGLRDLTKSSDRCDAHSEQQPHGMPDPTPTPSITSTCDPIVDYRGNAVPVRSLRIGSQVCGPGGQVLACDERQLSRPDGWRATGIPCGTSCGVCGPDPYGDQTPVCAYFADAEGLACDDASFAQSWNPCSNAPGVRINTPAYCGHSLPGIDQGDPNMLYVCKAYCPRWEGGPGHMAPCEGSEGLGGGGAPRTRRYFLDHTVYCALGCQGNGAAKSDECKRPGGGKRAAPIDDSRVIRGFGVVAEDYGGRHLGEDLVRSSGGTAGAEVHPVADGRLLWKGINRSQYLGAALVEHPPKSGTGERYCSFYGHLDVDGLAPGLEAGQQVTTDDVLGNVVRWNDIPRLHNLHFPDKWTECPTSSDKFTCYADGRTENSHLHYAVLSDAECRRFAGSWNTPYGYDECKTPDEDAVALTAMKAADGCTKPMDGATTEGYVSPTWFIEAPPQ